jgi:hypothetical protein
MSIFTISYDLYFPKDSKAFYYALASYPHAQIMDSFWLIEADSDAKTLRDELLEHLNGDDVLFVTQVSKDWAGAGTQCGQWLNASDRKYA